MKRVLLTVLVFITFNCYPQSNTSDGLKQLLRTQIEDTSRDLVSTQLSKNYWLTKPDTSFLLANQGIILARKIAFKKGEADCRELWETVSG